MPARKAPALRLSSEHERELKALVRAHSTPRSLAERARIILLAAAGLGVEESARQLGIWRKTAGHWRRRWSAADAAVGVAARLSDAPRCGAPAKFTPEVIRQIMALAERSAIPRQPWRSKVRAGRGPAKSCFMIGARSSRHANQR